MSEDINFGAITEALNDKADRDLNNMTANIDYVVESYNDEDGNWYRLYKSGWVEQGGFYGSGYTNYTTKTISLLKPFLSTYYSISLINATTGDCYEPTITAKTTTDFTVRNTTNLNSMGGWEAKGKGAEL